MRPFLAGLCAMSLTLAAGAAPAWAGDNDVTSYLGGEDLWNFCGKAADGSAPEVCVAYVLGGADMIFSWPAEAAKVCLPHPSSANDLTNAVRRFLRDHPDRMQDAASGIILDALEEAYPCR